MHASTPVVFFLPGSYLSYPILLGSSTTVPATTATQTAPMPSTHGSPTGQSHLVFCPFIPPPLAPLPPHIPNVYDVIFSLQMHPFSPQLHPQLVQMVFLHILPLLRAISFIHHASNNPYRHSLSPFLFYLSHQSRFPLKTLGFTESSFPAHLINLHSYLISETYFHFVCSRGSIRSRAHEEMVSLLRVSTLLVPSCLTATGGQRSRAHEEIAHLP